uniref:Uncharacterized protein n=1 Tax=Arundo donax TaxID=35708 RepID=A0A0A9H283_ARUDO
MRKVFLILYFPFFSFFYISTSFCRLRSELPLFHRSLFSLDLLLHFVDLQVLRSASLLRLHT